LEVATDAGKKPQSIRTGVPPTARMLFGPGTYSQLATLDPIPGSSRIGLSLSSLDRKVATIGPRAVSSIDPSSIARPSADVYHESFGISGSTLLGRTGSAKRLATSAPHLASIWRIVSPKAWT
jgi:hypothetical protein